MGGSKNRASTSILTKEKCIDINGLRPSVLVRGPYVNNKLKQKARSYLERFDQGVDYDLLMQQLADDEETKESSKDLPTENVEPSAKFDSGDTGIHEDSTKTKEVRSLYLVMEFSQFFHNYYSAKNILF